MVKIKIKIKKISKLKKKVDCYHLKNSIFFADSLVYFNTPNSYIESHNEFTENLIVVSEKKDHEGNYYIFCRNFVNGNKGNKRIYIYKHHFTNYIINGTLQFIKNKI